MGKEFQAKLANQRIFLVGCGALGCEYLKGLALMGAGTGKSGKIVVSMAQRCIARLNTVLLRVL